MSLWELEADDRVKEKEAEPKHPAEVIVEEHKEDTFRLHVVGRDLCHLSKLSNTGLGKTSLSGVFSVDSSVHVCVLSRIRL